MEDLTQLADLINAKSEIDARISLIIGRPALTGHVGEYIASRVFNIQLVESAAQKSIDGYFRDPPLIGKSVNIKWYAKQEGVLDITPGSLPVYYLILTGPISPAISSCGMTRPWLIDHVYLFQADKLVEKLQLRGSKIGISTSVIKVYWEEAEIYPKQHNPTIMITPSIREYLALFGSDRLK